MIPAGTKVFLGSHPVDFRKGPDGLAGLVRDAGADPFNGSLYVFRANRAIGSKSCGGTAAGSAFLPKGWKRRSSAGRGLATPGCSSTPRNCWHSSTDWIGKRFTKCRCLDLGRRADRTTILWIGHSKKQAIRGETCCSRIMTTAASDLPDDVDALKAMVLALAEKAA